jgi:hypothetical protein
LGKLGLDVEWRFGGCEGEGMRDCNYGEDCSWGFGAEWAGGFGRERKKEILVLGWEVRLRVRGVMSGSAAMAKFLCRQVLFPTRRN